MSLSRFEVEPVFDTDFHLVVSSPDKGCNSEETEALVAQNSHVIVTNSTENNSINDSEVVFTMKPIDGDGKQTESAKLVQTASEPGALLDVANKTGRFHVEFVDPPVSSPASPTHTVDTQESYTNSYYHRTFGHNTQEAIPKAIYYRNTESLEAKILRPTLDELHEEKTDREQEEEERKPTDVEYQGTAPVKFGWIKGVLVRCILNIWGVMLFLRLSWIVGQAGIGLSLLIILLSSVVTAITTLSMSAICTNGQVRGGGAYYLISRSLGPEFGGAIGLIFSLANAVAVAMYVIGFAETVVELMEANSATITGNMLNDTRIIGAITVLLLLGVTQLGMAWESKMQVVLLVILLLSILNFIIGSFIPATVDKMLNGFFSYDSTVVTENFAPQFRNEEGFFSMFAIFFPAATGILAGCNISGDLKDAQKAIPRGTLLAILITSTVYAIIAIMLGAVEVRHASSNIAHFIGAENTTALNCTTAACGLGWHYLPSGPNCSNSVSAAAVDKCFKAGLLNDYQAMQKISLFGPVIVAGIFAATLSSALTSLVSAPKVFQAVCKDKIFPAISFFGVGAPKTDEPRRGYILTFFIALGFVAIGELNVIAPIISNFFLASYTLINYSCFSASLSKSPGWRPAFTFYNMWLSLFGSFVCCAIMFVIEWWAALATIVIVLTLYKYVDYKKPNVNWGSSTQAYTYTQALNYTLKLNSVDEHVKNFRPQLMVLTGCPAHRPALVHLASHITRNVSLMVCANVKQQLGKYPFKENKAQQTWLHKQRFKAFYNCCVSPSLTDGVYSLTQVSGLGRMKPNTLLLGYKSDWKTASGKDVLDYTNIIHNAFNMNFGVCILRMQEGLDISQYLDEETKLETSGMKPTEFFLSQAEPENEAAAVSNSEPLSKLDRGSSNKLVNIAGSACDVNTAKLKASTQFQAVQEKGKTIDVWWLFDDGGLTILVPYLLSTRQQWAGCRLRIFTGGKKGRIDEDKRAMAQLVSKFRISFEDVTVFGDLNTKASKTAIQDFDEMIEPFRLHDEDGGDSKTESSSKDYGDTVPSVPAASWKITDAELDLLKAKTMRQIKLQELLQKHSKDAALILITLPIARKGSCSAALYMAWLEELTKNLPPVVLLRGNQTSVLTFYS